MTLTAESKIVSFDIELATELESAEQLSTIKHLDLSVAAVAIEGLDGACWYSVGDDCVTPAQNMSRDVAANLLERLIRFADDGYKVCAWNGVGFDLKWIGYAAGDIEAAARLALRIYDPMLQFFTLRGYPVSLAAVGDAMGIQQRKSMEGAEAPRAWARGEHQRVMEYVVGDCEITTSVIRRIVECRRIEWRTRKGVVSVQPIDSLLPAGSLLNAALPDQTWMSNPMTIDSFVGWIPTDIREAAAR